MQDWEKDVWQILAKTATEVESFLREMGEGIEQVVEEVGTAMESMFEPLGEDLFREMDSYIGELLESDFDLDTREDFNFFDDLDLDIEFYDISTVEPQADKNPACIGCANYHGKVYGGNLLVCAMHPHGWEEKNCPDWQAKENSK